MADIAFLLIIFFMVTISFEVDKTQVVLPKTDLRLRDSEEGRIHLDHREPARSGSRAVRRSAFRSPDRKRFSPSPPVSSPDPGKAFVLKADKDVPYELRRQRHRRAETGQGRGDLPALRAGDGRRRRRLANEESR